MADLGVFQNLDLFLDTIKKKNTASCHHGIDSKLFDSFNPWRFVVEVSWAVSLIFFLVYPSLAYKQNPYPNKL